MKKYALLLTALLVVAALVGLPPRTPSIFWQVRAQPTPERQAFLDLQEEIIGQNWLYQRIQWRDSILATLQDVDPEITPFVTSLPEWGRDTEDLTLEEGIRAHLESMGLTRPKIPVGVFFIPRDLGRHPRAPRDRYNFAWSRREFYVAREGEAPFCAVAESVNPEGGYNGLANRLDMLVFMPEDSLSKPNTLRICGYYARYGVPGPMIESWLREGGAVLGTGANQVGTTLALGRLGPLRGAFGRATFWHNVTESGLACLAGDPAACLRSFKEGKEQRPVRAMATQAQGGTLEASPIDFTSPRWWAWGHFAGYDGFIFETLEKDFGAAAFETFWTSGLGVEDAFRTAFGLPAEEWIMAWARDLYGPLDRGPVVPLGASAYTLLTLGVFAGLGLFAGRRKG